MKALGVLRALSSKPTKTPLNPTFFYRFYAAQPQQDDDFTHSPSLFDAEHASDAVFDSTHFSIPTTNDTPDASTTPRQKPTWGSKRNGLKGGKLDGGDETHDRNPTWDRKYRDKVEDFVIGDKPRKEKSKIYEEEKNRMLHKALLEMALVGPDDEVEEEDEERVVLEEDQKALTVGIIGAPNAGKSSLTNYMVGTKVAAVSRKTNTTTHEVLGVMTKGDTQICFFDTPGLTLSNKGCPYKDFKVRVESAWASINLYDVLIVIFDVHRHITRPDTRVIGLIKRMGAQPHPMQKRVLCMNKIDLVEKKKDLLTVAEQFKDLPGFERHFMISSLKGSGMKDLTQYLMNQAVKRSWDEDPFIMTEEVMKNISLEVVRERLLDHVHQEIPYSIDHRLMDWKELRDGSLRIEQHLITHKMSQRKILVGKKGCKIGRIGMEANEELRSIFKRDVHLILQVRLK